MALPIVIGWALGYETLGLAASVGGFAGLYGVNEVYRRRATVIGSAGAALVMAAVLGEIGSRNPWIGVGLVAIFAAIMALIMNSLRAGGPGAYMPMLVAATAAVPHPGTPFWLQPALIAGAAFLAFVIQMSGWLFTPCAPQRRVTIGVCRVVRAYIGELGTPAEDRARFMASRTLLGARDKVAPAHEVAYYRVLRDASDLFSRAIQHPQDAVLLHQEATALVKRAEALPYRWGTRAVATDPRDTEHHRSALDPGARPFSTKERVIGQLREGITARHSTPRDAALRVLVACSVAGAVGIVLGLDHAYWIMAAAVLVLHQGAPRTATLRRGAHRVAGTIIGLGLAATLLAFAPHGLVIAAILALLQVCVELTVSRNYGLGVVFITPLALLISYSLDPRAPLELVGIRGLDTLIGVSIAVIVLLIFTRHEHVVRLTFFMARALDAIDRTLATLDDGGSVTQRERRRVARHLERKLIDMQGAFDAINDESQTGHRAVAERWSSLVAIQRLGYALLASAWSVDHGQPLQPKDASELADAAWLARAAL